MKKIINITLVLAAAAVAFSCDKNLPKTFSDANAFVAFDKATAAIDEGVVDPETGVISQNPNTVKLPVTLGSVSGKTAQVSFEVKDGTAKAGVNYKVVTEGSLSFNASNRTQYIEIQPLYEDAYTGDLKLTVNLKPANGINVGAASTCTVTISDLDHPLSALIGNYEATASEAYQNPWTMTLYKDEDDDHVVWFFNLFANAGWAIDRTMYYGVVVEDESGKLDHINLPFGQTCEYKYSNSPIILFWLDADGNFGKDGSLDIKILYDANGNINGLDFGDELGFAPEIEDYIDPSNWDEGCISYVFPGVTAVKK